MYATSALVLASDDGSTGRSVDGVASASVVRDHVKVDPTENTLSNE